MTCLNLFSGTGSVSSQSKKRGHNTKTFDRDMDAIIKTDMLDWNYQEYPPHA